MTLLEGSRGGVGEKVDYERNVGDSVLNSHHVDREVDCLEDPYQSNTITSRQGSGYMIWRAGQTECRCLRRSRPGGLEGDSRPLRLLLVRIPTWEVR